jgi:hypothetical protein
MIERGLFACFRSFFQEQPGSSEKPPDFSEILASSVILVQQCLTTESDNHPTVVAAEPPKEKVASHRSKCVDKAQQKIHQKMSQSLRKAEEALRSNNFSAAAQELQAAKRVNASLTRTNQTFPIAYSQAMANLKSGSLKAIRANYATLKSLTQVKGESVYPFIFYVLAKYQLALKCPALEVENSLTESLQIFRFRLPELFVHCALRDLFPEMSCPLTLRDLVLKLTKELRTPAPPGDTFIIYIIFVKTLLKNKNNEEMGKCKT